MKGNVHTAEEVMDVLRSESEAIYDTLETLVYMESPSSNRDALRGIINYLDKTLKKMGYYTFNYPGKNTGGLLYARPKNREKQQPIQLMIGHCDTVWKKNTLRSMPYREGEKKISGPGAYDMKAGITQIIYTLKTLQYLGHTPEVLPVVLINTDEEIGSVESKRIIRRLARIAERAFVMEPPLGLEGKLKTERKGVGRFTLTVKGRAAHAGLDPEKGINAIVELSHQIQKLYAMNDPERGLTVNVGMISGGVSPNVVAPESSAVIDVRVNNKEDGKWITRKIMNLKPDLPDCELEITGGIGRAPMESNSRNRALWEMAQQKGAQLGLSLESGKAGGGSDGNITSEFTATLDGLGTPGDGAHADHEYILKESLIERTALLTLLVMEPSVKMN
ncbi:M20 family peptidase [Robertkochia marina]|uniref:M20 family peptidase n=1 Tax=Robertkochia marina TaxID=1227945 RepID=A0A4S3M0P5_9FLAO|nr:M20 family metallopeptidase [Robertkochia marina]THD67573.1 M20 family peptidase [Robertkochia marina]TRZ44559.1 M20 family peptidase [Robertkochia marina]